MRSLSAVLAVCGACSFSGGSVGGGGDAGIDGPEGMFLEGWGARRAITVPADNVASSQESFPLLVVLESDTDLAQNAAGNDIRFTDANGLSLLSFEVESFDGTDGDLVAWVRVPTLSATSDTVVYLYYDNPAAPTPSGASDTWDQLFAGVWHLEEEAAGTGSTDIYRDSTSAANHGEDFVSTSNEVGQIGRAPAFGSGADRVLIRRGDPWEFADQGLDNGTSDLTITAWVRYIPDVNQDSPTIFRKGGANDGDPGYWFHYRRAEDSLQLGIGDESVHDDFQSNAGIGIADGAWHHAAVVLTREVTTDRARFYLDGAPVGEDMLMLIAGTPMGGDDDVGIGGSSQGSRDWTGNLDEIRVSSGAREETWFATSFANQDDPLGFSNLGDPERAP